MKRILLLTLIFIFLSNLTFLPTTLNTSDAENVNAWAIARRIIKKVASFIIQRDKTIIVKYIRWKNSKIPLAEAEDIASEVVTYSYKYNVDPNLIAALISRESRFDRYAVSYAGAKGLGQIMPVNYKQLGILDPHNIAQNVRGTVKYFKKLLNIYKDESTQVSYALAAYKNGCWAVKRCKGNFLKSTTGYIEDIVEIFHKLENTKALTCAVPIL